MYLINAKTYKLQYFVGAGIPKYAILSHVWAEEEVLFQDLKKLKSAKKKKGFLKIKLTCHQTLLDNLGYAWIDTCCINKESSAELSEAINSMFRWYSRAATCYAFLSDVEVLQNDETELHTRPPFADSLWFTRGWTLQELIAPPVVFFMDRNWTTIGMKGNKFIINGSAKDLLNEIHGATGVDEKVLMDSSKMFGMDIAKRMSWVARRRTTRKEDEAYCLLGLFNVNMAMLYGEEEGAFVRLQEELIRQTTDQSVFVHDGCGDVLLASSPSDFEFCTDIESCLDGVAYQPYELTNAGLRISLPVLFSTESNVTVALNCHRNHRRLTMRLYKVFVGNRTKLLRTWDPIKDTKIETLLACPVEDIVIDRRSLSDRGHSFGPSAFAAQVWVGIPNQEEGEDLGLDIAALAPPELWQVAIPVRESIRSRIGASVRRAYFCLQDDFPLRAPDVGSVGFNLTGKGFETVVFGVRFNILPEQTTGRVYFHCNLKLYEGHTAPDDHLQSTSYGVVDATQEHFQVLSKPGSSLQDSITIKRLRITAVLEVLSNGLLDRRWSNKGLLLQLHVNRLNLMTPPDSESHEPVTFSASS